LLTGDENCPPVIIVFTSVFWRESWKYQWRAWRYCQHDMGHALGSLLLSAAALGWRGEVIGNFPDSGLEQLLGIKGGDEHPALVIGLKPGFVSEEKGREHRVIASQSEWEDGGFSFSGSQNVLSAEKVDYPEIDEVHRATCLSYPDWQEQLSDRVLNEVQKGSRLPELPSVADEVGAPYLLHLAEVKDETPKVHEVVRKRRYGWEKAHVTCLPFGHTLVFYPGILCGLPAPSFIFE
jgi:nitroreductase